MIDGLFNSRKGNGCSLLYLKFIEIIVQGQKLDEQIPNPFHQLRAKGIVGELLAHRTVDTTLPRKKRFQLFAGSYLGRTLVQLCRNWQTGGFHA